MLLLSPQELPRNHRFMKRNTQLKKLPSVETSIEKFFPWSKYLNSLISDLPEYLIKIHQCSFFIGFLFFGTVFMPRLKTPKSKSHLYTLYLRLDNSSNQEALPFMKKKLQSQHDLWKTCNCSTGFWNLCLYFCKICWKGFHIKVA